MTISHFIIVCLFQGFAVMVCLLPDQCVNICLHNCILTHELFRYDQAYVVGIICALSQLGWG